jgi:pimeloyl-ACP methyl ester carboxylesterase
MIHGFGSSWAVWRPLIAAVRKNKLLTGIDIVAIDLPGFGLSENKLGHLHSAEVGRELLDFLHALGYTKIRIAGHSMGGFLTLDMAVNYPEEICSIHVVSASYFRLLGMVNSPLKTAIGSPFIAVFYGIQLFLSYHEGLSRWLNRALARRPSARAGHKPHYLLGGPAFRYGAANGNDYDADERWSSLKPAVNGVFGESDPLVTPADMAHLQSLLPQSKLTLIPKSGHSSLVEQPEIVAKALFSEID